MDVSDLAIVGEAVWAMQQTLCALVHVLVKIGNNRGKCNNLKRWPSILQSRRLFGSRHSRRNIDAEAILRSRCYR